MEKIIQSLLFDNDTVEIPGLGVFKKRFRSSHIDAENNIHPPTSKPTFDIDRTVNGKNLIGALAVANNLSTEDASVRLKEYTNKINSALSDKGSYSFEGLGTLLKFPSGKVDFAPSEGSNFFLETLGFKSIRLPNQVVDINTKAKADAAAKTEVHEAVTEEKETPTVQEKAAQSREQESIVPPVLSAVAPVVSAVDALKSNNTPEPKAKPEPVEKKSIATVKPVELKKPIETPKPVEQKKVERTEKEIAKPAEPKQEKPAPVKAKQEKIDKAVKEPAKVSPKRVIAEPRKKSSIWKMVLPLLFLLFSAWGLFKFFGGSSEEAAVLNNTVQQKEAAVVAKAATSEAASETVVESDTAENTSESATQEKDALKESQAKPVKRENTNKASTGEIKKGYHIVIGAFGNEANANKLVNSLRNKGYDIGIIKTRSLNQVAVYGSNDMGSAEAMQAEMVSIGYPDAWIMKRK